MNKIKLKRISSLLVLILVGSLLVPLMAKGAEKSRKAFGGLPVVEFSYEAVTDGKYLYYCPDWNYGLIKRNLKTGKEVVIADMLGVRYLSIYGKNIYFSYSRPSSTSYAPYIYKMNKNGKNIKKLVAGDSPVIVGEKVFYVGGRIVKVRDEDQFSKDGIYSMSLSGMNKEKVSNKKTYKIGVCGNDVYYAKSAGIYPNEDYYTLSGTKVTDKIIPSGLYNVKRVKNFKVKNNEVLEGNNKDGKFQYKTIAVFKGENIIKLISCGNNLVIILNGFDKKANCGIGKAYLINYKGKKILLKKWYLVG